MTIIAESASAACPVQAATPDPVYHHSDGDLEVLVGHTIFRIHSFAFARHSASRMKLNIATSPGEQSVTEGQLVVLNDLTPDDFRALCWAVYLHPGDAQPGIDDIDRMLRVASMSHTYGITTLLKWACQYLTDTAARIAGLPAVERPGWDPPFLSRLLRVCVARDLTAAVQDFQDIWIDRLAAKDTSAFPEAIATAEDLRLRRLQGYAYYYQLIVAHERESIPSHRATLYDIPGLTEEQKFRLADGYRSLTIFCEEILDNDIRAEASLLDSSVCNEKTHQTTCIKYIRAIVNRAFGSPDLRVFEAFGYIDKVIGELRGESHIRKPCRMAAIERLTGLRKRVEDTMADHFTPISALRLGMLGELPIFGRVAR
ncbi:uncharacterized protein SCHCODRAFT_02605856 [Schizophyllum commune H4-8]|uniref:BTB domain-containing protein n=1 Tax=Schizophyllum commune (strain H4-8 / FGSC 9210) TaxID=578458 RepID=D8PSG9_SCHCM|nr:uncharacterized protein SCHCODRAFT_02605856 [Schizophyllum commune H4-8]KAI5899694.1 hypothetical protein SCHCODRAFT_02605856 [Schizophyllum commune H4-8]